MSAIRRVLPAILVPATLAACASAVRSDRDETIPVPQGATWAWAPADTTARPDRGPAPFGEIVQQRFHRAMEAAMAAKGYREVAAVASADFVLSADFGDRQGGAPPARNTAVAVGFSTGWGYRPWGIGRFGYFAPVGFWAPWGPYQPWGWGFSGARGFGWGYAAPLTADGRRLYSDRALVVVLRERPTGQVAWSARLASDALGSRRLTEERVRDLTGKLFGSLH